MKVEYIDMVPDIRSPTDCILAVGGHKFVALDRP